MNFLNNKMDSVLFVKKLLNWLLTIVIFLVKFVGFYVIFVILVSGVFVMILKDWLKQ